MPNDAAAFLLDAGEEAWNVNKSHERNIENVAEPDEAGGLVGSVDVQRASRLGRLVRDQPHHQPSITGEADDRFLAKSA